MSDAFAEGFEAYVTGVSVTDNPYEAGTPDHLSWNDGWQEGADQAEPDDFDDADGDYWDDAEDEDDDQS